MDLIKLLKFKNHQNILLYNLESNNLLIDALNNIYKIEPTIQICSNDIKYKKNNIYFEFDVDKIKYKHKIHFINIIKDIVNTNNRIYIILNNLEDNKSIQNILKKIIEKNYHIGFVVVCKKITNIIDQIKSRFLCIRIPNNTITINKYKKHIFDYIFDLYYENNIKNIIKNIKYISYILRCINDSFCIFLKEILEYIINRVEIIYEIKCQCIFLISDIEYKYNKGYYKIIYYEYLFIKLYDLIKT